MVQKARALGVIIGTAPSCQTQSWARVVARRGRGEQRASCLLRIAGARHAALPVRAALAAPAERRRRLLLFVEGFVAAASFEGARTGFAFKTGSMGLGYYPDDSGQRQVCLLYCSVPANLLDGLTFVMSYVNGISFEICATNGGPAR
jgi:hypothetical protein